MSDQYIPREPLQGLTFEKVWAALMELREYQQETARQIKENSAETDRQIKEMSAETDRQIKEMSAETDRQMKETDRVVKETTRTVGNLGNKLGLVVEQLVLANIREKFNQLGFRFSRTVSNVIIEDFDRNIFTEIDAMLENGEYALAIEVKTQLNVSHVKEHAERMEKLRRHADGHRDRRKFLGAVAGAVTAESVRKYAQKQGFYVIQQSGDTVTVEIPEGFKPRQW
ncbi:MAG: hypothetical protein LBL70_03240 [Treponema sp.]|jgi:hypothetical protein|nr:hypothetical protein [Treponema sp.]